MNTITFISKHELKSKMSGNANNIQGAAENSLTF